MRLRKERAMADMEKVLPEETGNNLFPVFFRLDKLQVLVVGGGMIGLEKVNAIFNTSPYANVTLVAPDICQEIKALSEKYNLTLVNREYQSSDLEGKDLVLAGTSIKELNQRVADDARKQRVLINVADTPDLCDFYLSSIVKKGDLKIAISTNGKSPTFAKRIRELLEEVLPDNINNILENLKQIREKMAGDFEYKVKKLDEITSVMKTQNDFNKNKNK